MFVDPQDATRVGLLMDVPDMETLQAAMETEGAAEAMAHDGVLPETLVILVEAYRRPAGLFASGDIPNTGRTSNCALAPF